MNIRVLDEAAIGIAADDGHPCVVLDAAPGQHPLQMAIWRSGATAVVRLRGSAEMAEAEALCDELAILTNDHVPVVVLDLSELEFIGSPGLSAIVECFLRMRRYGGQLRLAAPREAVRRVFERTRLGDLLPICASVQQALAT